MPQSSIIWHLAPIQLRRGKVLLEKPVLKQRRTKKHPTTVVASQHSGESTETFNSVSSNSTLRLRLRMPYLAIKCQFFRSRSSLVPTTIEAYKTDV
jgi:hypothetical protein